MDTPRLGGWDISLRGGSDARRLVLWKNRDGILRFEQDELGRDGVGFSNAIVSPRPGLEKLTACRYFLTMTAFQPLYGRISDVFGRKAALCFSFGLFALGCLWCGLAKSMTELIAARAFTGIGGGGMTTVVAILLSDVVSLRDRGTWQGYNNIVYATGAGLGAPLGGALVDTLGWRW